MYKNGLHRFRLAGAIALLASFLLAPITGYWLLYAIKLETPAPQSPSASDLDNFQLVDPEQSPPEIRDAVMYGFRLITQTSELLPKHVGGKLNCCYCHFAGGNTTGGKNNGISLVGVAALYPTHSKRSPEVISLPQRVNECFKRSMNGLPLAFDSREMNAIIAYLQWISKDLPIYGEIPWRGLPSLTMSRAPNVAEGEKQFSIKCATCHGVNGEGKKTIPPLWGANSFNDGAGMNNLDTFASFILLNMPFQYPELTEEEAFDIASFVTKQPRPHYEAVKN